VEIEKEVERLIDGGADFYFPSGSDSLVGFGEIVAPNLFFYCDAFFESSHHFHFIKFDRVDLLNERNIAFLQGNQIYYLIGADPQERDCANVDEWKKVRSRYFESWLAEKEMRLNW